MKKIALIVLASILVIVACKKKDIPGESKVVKVPKFELIGPTAFSTPAGPGSYSDPGVKFTDEQGVESIITTPTSSDVDLSVPGFYSLTYEKKTEYGYNLKASRLILVTPVSSTDDYSGIYARSSNSQTVTVTKIGTGLYTTDNVGGVAGNNAFVFDVYFGLVNDSDIVIPPQTGDAIGDFYGTNGKLRKNAVDTTLEWKLVGSAFGPSLRKFVKQ
ncbi:MAG: hypothetical protein HY062_01480 [Bacteroidetes bacterium]|nr:hypothetical protein [Bacteroidota bacterium]